MELEKPVKENEYQAKERRMEESEEEGEEEEEEDDGDDRLIPCEKNTSSPAYKRQVKAQARTSFLLMINSFFSGIPVSRQECESIRKTTMVENRKETQTK